jgi:ankyrin repeat protein
MTLDSNDPLSRTLIQTIHAGNLASLESILATNPGLSSARIKERGGSKTPLHVVADWPGFFPNGPAIVKALISAGADPDAGTEGDNFRETPLHWTASNDDVEVAEALILGGADLEVRGGSIAGGTALDNAIGYGCWRVARLLLERGAKVEKLWHAAALGMTSRLKDFFEDPAVPSPEELNNAFWQACHGGYRRTAEYLLARGADLNWVPDYAKQTPLGIANAGGLDTGRQALVNWLRDRGAKSDS